MNHVNHVIRIELTSICGRTAFSCRPLDPFWLFGQSQCCGTELSALEQKEKRKTSSLSTEELPAGLSKTDLFQSFTRTNRFASHPKDPKVRFKTSTFWRTEGSAACLIFCKTASLAPLLTHLAVSFKKMEQVKPSETSTLQGRF